MCEVQKNLDPLSLERSMNISVVDRRRSLLPAFNLLLASSAVVLAVIAIAADDVGSASPSPAAPVLTIVGPAHPLGAADVGIPCNELVYTRC
jgi:hypothetical protein